MSVGLAGVQAAGRRGHQGSGGVIRAAAGSGWKEQAGQMIGRAARCSSGRPSPPRPGRSGRPSPSSGRRQGGGRARPGGGRARPGQRQGVEDGQKKKPGQAARCVRCCSGFASLPAWWCRAVVLPGGGGGADRGQAAGTSPAAQFPPAQFQPEPFQGGTVSPPDDPAKCRRAKGSDSSLNGISPHR